MRYSKKMTAVALCVLPAAGHAQAWVDMLRKPGANLYAIQAAHEREEDSLKRLERAAPKTAEVAAKLINDWNVLESESDADFMFKRMQGYLAPRVYPSGDIGQASRFKEEALPFLGLNGIPVPAMAGQWTPVFPATQPTSDKHVGRTNFLRFHPGNANILYTGTPGGGLWVSQDAGLNWTTRTDQLAVLGVSDIAIDPANPNIHYIATGDGDHGDSKSIGVLKSVDGGLTWNTTGLAWQVSQGRTIARLLLNPANPNILLAGTSEGIYRTADAGATWTQIITAEIRDMEFKPGDPNTAYAGGADLYRSVNGGATFAKVAGLPTVYRMSVAVTPADPNLVMSLCANQADFNSLYKSADGGASFTKVTVAQPNILGYSTSGAADGAGQSFYDLGFDISPTNAQLLLVGAIYAWRSTNGGAGWTMIGDMNNGMHVDIHDVRFLPTDGVTLFLAADGGIYKSVNNGTSWTALNTNLQIGQIYRLGTSPHSMTRILAGLQDVGVHLYENGSWKVVNGSDGWDGIFDWNDPNGMYLSTIGNNQYSANNGQTWRDFKPDGGNWSWNTAMVQDPKAAATLYWSDKQVFKSTDRGVAWQQQAASFNTGEDVVNLLVDPTNTQNVYAVKPRSLAKSTNGGGAWTNIATGLPTGSAQLTSVAVDPANSNNLWVSLSGYSANNKVYKSVNGGSAWTNYSDGLPNLPANFAVFEKNSDGGLYLATDVGVYYRDNTMAAWVPFFSGMPNVQVSEMEITYGAARNQSRLRASTFGRGLWETPLYGISTGVSPQSPGAARRLEAVLEPGAARRIGVRFVGARGQRYSLEVLALRGERIRRHEIGEVFGDYRCAVEVPGAPTGVYLLVVKSGEGRAVKRVFLP